VVAVAYHNHVKTEQRANKFRIYTSAFANPVGRVRYVTWKWYPVMTHRYVKEFDVILFVTMVVFVKILVIVIGAIVLTVIPVATVRKKSMSAIQRLVKMEQLVEI